MARVGSMRISKAARWMLALPAMIISWYIVFILGLYTFFLLEEVLCPRQDWVSGSCYNEFVQQYLSVHMHMFVALAAMCVVLVGRFVVPNHKQLAICVIYILGALVAGYLGFSTRNYSLAVSAFVGGLLPVLVFLYLARSNATLGASNNSA